MSRRAKPEKRVILPDVRYQSANVSLFRSPYDAKWKEKHWHLRLIYDALDIVKEKTGKEPMEVLDTGIEKCWSFDGSKTHAVLVVLPTRFQWKYLLPAAIPWRCAGSLMLPAPALEIPLLKNWQPN